MTRQRENEVDSALYFLQIFLEMRTGTALEGLDAILHKLSKENDFETILQIFEEGIKMFPNSHLVYYNAAKACECWSDKLAGDYFESKPEHSMHPLEWMCGEGSPYPKFKELRSKAAGYLEKVIELDDNLLSETRNAIEEKMALFRWA